VQHDFVSEYIQVPLHNHLIRLDDYECYSCLILFLLHYNYYNANLSSYIQTIEQTDKLLEQIYQTLQAQNHSFSLLYFSDHGLETKDRNSPKASLAHGISKASFRVPFVIINSNDTLHKEVHINKSGYHFIEGFAQWLGIKESSLNSSYNFLSPPSDTLKVFTGEYVPFDSLTEDSIIIIK